MFKNCQGTRYAIYHCDEATQQLVKLLQIFSWHYPRGTTIFLEIQHPKISFSLLIYPRLMTYFKTQPHSYSIWRKHINNIKWMKDYTFKCQILTSDVGARYFVPYTYHKKKYFKNIVRYI